MQYTASPDFIKVLFMYNQSCKYGAVWGLFVIWAKDELFLIFEKDISEKQTINSEIYSGFVNNFGRVTHNNSWKVNYWKSIFHVADAIYIWKLCVACIGI